MNARPLLIAGLVSVMMLFSGCARLKASHAEASAPPSQKIAVLNHGYAMLYGKAQELANAHNLLRVKQQSKDTANTIDAISSFGHTLSQQLQSLVKRYPALSLKHTGLPLVEKKKKKYLADYYLKQMAPVTGRTGKDFDRTILISQRGELNQVRFYARAIASVERDANRKQLMQTVQKHAADLYKEVSDQLQNKYYAH